MPEIDSPNLAARANRLYWTSDRSAAAVADELGISRSKLYALIEPLPVDRICERCGGEMAFSNRTDREAGRARCTDCDARTEVPSDAAVTPEPEGDDPTPETGPGPLDDLEAVQGLVLGAACGLAAGFLAGAWLRRR